MPFLDVSDVLADPDFCETIAVIRTATATSASGRSELTPVIIPGVTAVVQPATSNDLVRMLDADSLSGSIAVFTTYPLIVQAEGFAADQIQWNGRVYTVRTLDDWSQFGGGYVRALAGLTGFV